MIGNEFGPRELARLVSTDLRERLQEILQALTRKHFVLRQGDSFAGTDAFRFRHILIRDAAYQSLPKRDRSDLHARFAEWLEQSPSLASGQTDEIVGYHLEQVARTRAELGEPDEDFGLRAAARLAVAGRRALARQDASTARSLMARTIDLLPAGDPTRVRFLTDLANFVYLAGELDDALRLYEQAIDEARSGGLRPLEVFADMEKARIGFYTDPAVTADIVVKRANAAVAELFRLGEDGLRSRVAADLALIALIQGQAGLAERILRDLPVLAEPEEGLPPSRVPRLRLGATLLGPAATHDGIRLCEQMLASDLDDRRTLAATIRTLAALRAMRGEFNAARELLRRDEEILDDLGIPVVAAAAQQIGGTVELLAGDPEAAERILRNGYEALYRMNEQREAAELAASLARALEALGRDDDAFDLATRAERGSGIDCEIRACGTRARVLAKRGAMDEALRVADHAIARARSTDFLNAQGDALLDFAHVSSRAGRDASPIIEEAAACYEAKENQVAAENARVAQEQA